MFKYYLKLALRNLQGNKLTKGVKIVGMALAITVSMVIFLFVNHERNYDQFFSNHENVYRIINNREKMDGTQSTSSGTPIPLAGEIGTNFPEIKSICRMSKNEPSIFYYNELAFETKSTFFADSTFFKIYNVNILVGDANHILTERFAAVISKKTAEKIFGDEAVVGKTMKWNNKSSYTITGVFEDFPSSSFMSPEVILSIKSHPWIPRHGKSKWDAHTISTLVLLQPETDLKNLSEKIDNLVADKVKLYAGDKEWKFELQPITNVHFDKYSWGGFKKGINRDLLRILILTAFFVIMVAVLNHINISANIRLKQLKQNSVDKVFGMKNNQQFRKILTETIFDFFIALVLTMFLLTLFIPQINQLLEIKIQLFDYPLMWVLCIASVVIISILTTFFESIIVSKISFVNALKGQLGKKQSGKRINQIILITQYATAVILIFLTTVVFMQTRFLINRDLGMNKENVLIIKALTVKFNETDRITKKHLFLDEIKKFPEVESATFTEVIPSTSARSGGFFLKGKTRESVITCARISTDNNFIETFGIPLIAGENLRQQSIGNKNSDVLITRSTAKLFGFEDPIEAIGKYIVRAFNNITLNVVGVTEDFYLNNLYPRDIKMGIILENRFGTKCAVKYSGTNPLTLVNKIQNIWKDVYEVPSMNYYFLNDSYRLVYKNEIIQRQIFLLFALTSVLIACFGLFAMSFETIVQRIKEIGIRKVNGAKTQNIINMLFSNYIWIITVSIIPGLILSYLIASRWLENYDNKIPISWYYYVIPIILIAMVTIISVIYHSYKAAVSNPIDALKYE